MRRGKAERKARRRRAERRRKALAWAENTQTDEPIKVTVHGKSMRFYYAPGKVGAHWETGGMYEQPLLEHIYSQRFSGVAIDAGANVGNHTIWFTVVCGVNVVAFEPIKHVELQRNVELNSLEDKVRIETVALGERPGLASHQGRGKLSTGQGSIRICTLDSFNLDNVSFIKADVEGMEAHLLRGGVKTIRRCKPIIFAEQWTNKEHQAIAGVLEPLGYKMRAAFSSKGSPSPVGRWDPVR